MNFKSVITIAVFLALLFFASIAFSQILILAPDEFIDELEPLKRFKNCSGRLTILLSLTQVYNNFPGGVDEAEKVKKCIEHYEKFNGIKHVLLVGDVDKFPVRWRWWGLPQQEYWGVSDLYYADLYDDGTTNFNDWDSNNNGLYGEIEFAPDGTINNDNIDFHPDVSLGRIPASTDQEVTAYVKKVIRYELKTAPWTTWFRRAALYTGTWYSWSNAEKDTVEKFLTNAGFTNFIKRYTNFQVTPPQLPPGVPGVIVSDLNSGVGFANYLGHGNIWGWACLGFNTSQLDNLTNSDMLPVAFGGACETGMFAPMARFHPYKDVNGNGHWGTTNGETLNPGSYPHVNLPKPACLQDGQFVHDGTTYEFDYMCFAEPFIFGDPIGSTGVIAYLGARSGARQWIMKLDKFFFKAYDAGGHRVLGDMWKYMIEEYYDYYDLDNANTWPHQSTDWDWGQRFDEPQKLILFGDPSLIVGGAFTTILSDNVYNGNGGPLMGFSRYRIVEDVTVPTGQTLSVDSTVSILFENEKKITAMDTSPNKGFIVNPGYGMSVCFMSLSTDPQSEHIFHGMKINGQLKLRNGGEIKLY